MKRGEWAVLALIALMVGGVVTRNMLVTDGAGSGSTKDRGIPFYTTASPELARAGSDLVRQNQCRQCHSLWSVRDMMQAVPSPPLDGIGSLRDEAWLYQYFSASNPQSILPSRLKPEYRMPSYKDLPEADRRTLARYVASLKVQDWYLEETRKTEFEKLTGKDYKP